MNYQSGSLFLFCQVFLASLNISQNSTQAVPIDTSIRAIPTGGLEVFHAPTPDFFKEWIGMLPVQKNTYKIIHQTVQLNIIVRIDD